MSMNWKGALAAGAVLGAGVLAACSDSPTAPASRAAFVPKSSFVVGPTADPTPVATELKICKAGDVGGTFTINNVEAGIGGSGNPTIIDDDAGTAGNQVSLDPGECVIAVEDLGNATFNIGDFFTVTESLAAGVTTEVECFLNNDEDPGVADGCGASFFINTAHGWTLVYTNTAPPPPDVCTYTKGWYQNKNGTLTIIDDVDDLTIAQQQLVFGTQPNNKATITWDGGNNGLNLYQQFLAALNNLGNNEDAGPDAVDAAIDLVQDNTSFNGSHITINLTQQQISDAINTLSSFNEGQFAGFPHCGDEILPI
jgi:hypothetical protein